MQPHARSERSTWIMIVMLLLFILGKGLFVYLVVGDKGQPDWDYRSVQDVPGESPYAIYEPLPHRQHIRGRGNK
jgi:flagellar basal body-associated protein FliL